MLCTNQISPPNVETYLNLAPPEEKEYIPSEGETCNLSAEDRRVKLLASDFSGTVTSTDVFRLGVQTSTQFKYGSNRYRESILKDYADLHWRWRNEIEKIVRGRLKKSYSCRFNLGGIEYLIWDITLENVNWAKRIAHKHTFDDVLLPRLKLAAKEVKLFSGVLSFIEKLKTQTTASFRILSLSYFDELVYASLDGLVPKEDIFTGRPPVLNGATRGLMKSDLTNGFDKRNFLRLWRNANKSEGKVIFVGDDITDLLALLEADIGFILKGNERTVQIAKHFGVTVLPISRLLHTQLTLENSEETEECGKKKVLYLVDSWSEIEEFVFGTC